MTSKKYKNKIYRFNNYFMILKYFFCLMTVEEKINIINNLKKTIIDFELKISSEPINSEFKNILEGLQEIRKHEK